MPEVVDTCSLASPASVCQTKHLHLRCSIDFTRRVLSGTAALTVQSQEDNLRSLVRWDMLPGGVPSSPWPPVSRLSPRFGPFLVPALRLLHASVDAPPQLTTLVLYLLFSLNSFLSAPSSAPYASHIDPSQPNWSLCIPSLPTMYTCLLLRSFPPKPPSQFLDTSWCPFQPRSSSSPQVSS